MNTAGIRVVRDEISSEYPVFRALRPIDLSDILILVAGGRNTIAEIAAGIGWSGKVLSDERDRRSTEPIRRNKLPGKGDRIVGIDQALRGQ